MPSLGAIVVGIGSYRYNRQQFPLLRYASKDADEVVQYVMTCWSKSEEAKLIRITEENATEDAIAAAFVALGKEGPFDLQLVFLSGHAWMAYLLLYRPNERFSSSIAATLKVSLGA
jgi:hypothetical protein